MADIARYYHSTLYSFEDERARTAILDEFHRNIKNAAISCCYDHKQQEFQLVCPNELGGLADEALFHAISTYVQSELDAADREEREPIIQRFAESQFQTLDTFVVDDGDEVEAESKAQTAPALALARSRASHLVMSDDGERMLRLFHMNELPDRLLERAIAPRSQNAARMFRCGVTCRATRLHQTGSYVFNGRTGVGEEDTVHDEGELGLADFPVLQDQRDVRIVENNAPAKTWEHVGRPPTVEAWVAGTGQVRQLPPEEKPEMPKDAAVLFSSNGPPQGRGRARQVKGAQHAPDPDEEEYRNEVPKASKPRIGLAEMLALDRRDDEINSKSTSSRSAGSSSDEGVRPSFDKLLSGAPEHGNFSTLVHKPPVEAAPAPNSISNISAPQDSCAVSSAAATATTVTPPLPLCNGEVGISVPRSIVHNSSSATPIRPASESPLRDYRTLPDYGKAFAKVDGVGLTANPSSVAEWQHNHPSLPKRRAKGRAMYSRGQVSRSLRDSEISDPASAASRAREGTTTSTSECTTTENARPCAQHTATTSDWVNKIVPPLHLNGDLIDDSARSAPKWTPVPPGMWPQPPLSRTRMADPTDFGEPTEDLMDFSAENTETSILQPHMHSQTTVSTSNGLTGTLIDIYDNVVEATDTDQHSCQPQLHNSQVPHPTSPSSQLTTAFSSISLDSECTIRPADYLSHDETDIGLIERVQTLPPDFATKRNTMRQRAGKKKKQKSLQPKAAEKQSGKAVLPLPDPVPPPKPRKVEPPPPLNGLQRENRQGECHTQPAPFPAQMNNIHSETIMSPTHAFGQQLRENLAGPIDEDEDDEDRGDHIAQATPIRLVAQVGLLLTRRSKKDDDTFDNGPCSPQEMQKNLNRFLPNLITEFVPRLTTSTHDAKLMIAVGGKPTHSSSSAYYEIFIRDSSNTILQLTVPTSAEQEYSLTTQNLIISTAFAHFPMHVWDARFLLRQPGIDAKFSANEAIQEFVASMHTDNLPPSFVAQVRPGAFTVQSVLAKQSILQDRDGMLYRVVKVQELRCGSIDGSQHNFRATAAPEDVMIEEQRLWREMNWETSDLSRAEEMEARVKEVVSQIDRVGLRNEGPFQQVTEDAEAVGAETTTDGVVWYW